MTLFLKRRKVRSSWFILILGLIWAVQISDGYLDMGLFSPANLDIIRQLTFIVLTMVFLVRFITLAEARILDDLESQTEGGQGRLDPTTLHALAKLTRLSVVISAVLVALPTSELKSRRCWPSVALAESRWVLLRRICCRIFLVVS